MAQVGLRSRPLSRWERTRHRLRRRIDRYRNNMAVGVAFVVMFVIALAVLRYLLSGA